MDYDYLVPRYHVNAILGYRQESLEQLESQLHTLSIPDQQPLATTTPQFPTSLALQHERSISTAFQPPYNHNTQEVAGYQMLDPLSLDEARPAPLDWGITRGPDSGYASCGLKLPDQPPQQPMPGYLAAKSDYADDPVPLPGASFPVANASSDNEQNGANTSGLVDHALTGIATRAEPWPRQSEVSDDDLRAFVIDPDVLQNF